MLPGSGGGLYYTNYDEFRGVLQTLERDAPLRARLEESMRARADRS